MWYGEPNPCLKKNHLLIMGRQQASKVYKTKRKTRDADQILNDDLKSHAAVHALENQKFDEYLPGLAQHYCIPCAKYFESDVALTAHKRKKVHKRQLRNLQLTPSMLRLRKPARSLYGSRVFYASWNISRIQSTCMVTTEVL